MLVQVKSGEDFSFYSGSNFEAQLRCYHGSHRKCLALPVALSFWDARAVIFQSQNN